MSAEKPADSKSVPSLPRGVSLLRRPRDFKPKTGLMRYADKIESVLVGRGVHCDPFPMTLDRARGVTRLIKKGLVAPFIKFVLRKRGNGLIVHATDEMAGFFFPWVKESKVVSVHHVISPGERGVFYYAFWKLLSTLSVRHADAVIAVSDETAADILKTFDVTPDKLFVVPETPNPLFKPTGAPKERKICCVGELTPRKNISDSIAVFGKFLENEDVSDYHLIICGKGSEKESLQYKIEALGLSNNVNFVSDLSDSEMVDLYETSMACLNTSTHEGFGLVPLESQSCGTPTLHFSHARLPAIALGASIPCGSVDEMAKKLHALVTDEREYQTKVNESLAYVCAYSDDFEKRLMEVYGKIAQDRSWGRKSI